MSIIKEFKAFALKGQVVDLAVGVIIGGAFGKIVSSLVGDIIMPLINPLIPGGNWKTIEVGPAIKLGSFLGNTVDFVIIALVIFLMLKALKSGQKADEPAAAGPTNEEKLLMEIRDALKR
ncbi:MAG: large conductance mechanosensitive channel protein MscL [Opitutaceae bacterium]|nr:large conductance mechanosensitive channel protein MscL [Opitutaceae bacterium]